MHKKNDENSSILKENCSIFKIPGNSSKGNHFSVIIILTTPETKENIYNALNLSSIFLYDNNVNTIPIIVTNPISNEGLPLFVYSRLISPNL